MERVGAHALDGRVGRVSCICKARINSLGAMHAGVRNQAHASKEATCMSAHLGHGFAIRAFQHHWLYVWSAKGAEAKMRCQLTRAAGRFSPVLSRAIWVVGGHHARRGEALWPKAEHWTQEGSMRASQPRLEKPCAGKRPTRTRRLRSKAKAHRVWWLRALSPSASSQNSGNYQQVLKARAPQQAHCSKRDVESASGRRSQNACEPPQP